jgi:hypothetical protein
MDVGQVMKEVRDSLTSRVLWAFLFGCSALTLILPAKAAALLGIEDLRQQFRPWLGAAVLVSGVGLLVSIGPAIGTALRRRRQTQARLELLISLTPEEKAILARYILSNTKTQEFDPSNGMVKSLLATGILYVPSQHFDLLEGMTFLIAPWAWDYLRKHPELLSVTPEENEQLQKRFARKKRW